MKSVGVVLVAVLLPLVAFAAPDDYAIQLTRPTRVGDRYRLEAKGTTRELQRITLGGQTQNEDEEISVRLAATATVLTVDAKTRAARTEYLVESLQRTRRGKTEDVLSAGRKVVAESSGSGKTAFTVDGDPALEDVSKALGVVITATAADSPTDDEIFGTAERRRVGDTWAINSATAAAHLSRAGLVVAPEDLKGTVSLTSVRTIGSARALEITAHLRSDRMRMDDLPAWLEIEKISFQGDFTGYAPLDAPPSEPLPDKLHMRIDVRMRGERPETGAPVVVEIGMETSQERSYLPLSSEPPARASGPGFVIPRSDATTEPYRCQNADRTAGRG